MASPKNIQSRIYENTGEPIDAADLDVGEVATNPTDQKVFTKNTSGQLIEVGNVSGGGVTDHGLLTGLLDDDHPQYLNEARGDARYDALGAAAAVQTNLNNHVGNKLNPHEVTYAQLSDAPTSLPPDPHTHPLADITDDGTMAAVDDAPNDNERYVRRNQLWETITPGVTDHGALTGLADDDHPQYLTQARGDARYDSLGAAAAVQSDLDSHKSSTNNPHAVTAAQTGAAPLSHQHTLSDVTDSGSMAAVNDAPANGVLYGRKNNLWSAAAEDNHTHPTDHSHVNKAQLDLITDGDHDVRVDNPHGVTAAQAGAAPLTHVHTLADDITDEGSLAYEDDAPSDGEEYVRKNGVWSVNTGGSGGITDHGLLTGLGDDDHLHYLTQARGDARYDAIGAADNVQSNLDTHTADITNPHQVTYAQLPDQPTIISDHGGLSGLGDDDHPHYLNNVRGDARYDALGSAAGVQSNLDSHESDQTNPHNVTAAQVGAAPTSHTHVLADVTDSDAMAAEPDAPVDGQEYVRKDGLWAVKTEGGGGVTDHGELTGLSHDDHPHYLNNARGDARYSPLGHTHGELHSHTNKAQLDLVTDGDHDVRIDNPHNVQFSQLSDAPSSLPPDAHTHTLADVTDSDEMAGEDDAPDAQYYSRAKGAWHRTVVPPVHGIDGGPFGYNTSGQDQGNWSLVATKDAVDGVAGNLDDHVTDLNNPHEVSHLHTGAHVPTDVYGSSRWLSDLDNLDNITGMGWYRYPCNPGPQNMPNPMATSAIGSWDCTMLVERHKLNEYVQHCWFTEGSYFVRRTHTNGTIWTEWYTNKNEVAVYQASCTFGVATWKYLTLDSAIHESNTDVVKGDIGGLVINGRRNGFYQIMVQAKFPAAAEGLRTILGYKHSNDNVDKQMQDIYSPLNSGYNITFTSDPFWLGAGQNAGGRLWRKTTGGTLTDARVGLMFLASIY